MAHEDIDLESCLEYNPQPLEECFGGGNLLYEDIDEILANVPGEADGPDWHWIVRLKPKKLVGTVFTLLTYWLIEGGCDSSSCFYYTGWD